MNRRWPVLDAKARFSELLDITLAEGTQMVIRRGVDIAVLLPIRQWRMLERIAKPALTELHLALEAPTENLTPPRRKSS